MAERDDGADSGPAGQSAWDRLGELPDLADDPLDADWLGDPVPTDRPRDPGQTPQDLAPKAPVDPRQFRVAPGPPVSRPPLSPTERALPEEPPPEWDTPKPSVRPRRRTGRWRWLRALLFVMLLAVAGGTLWGFYLWSQVDRVQTANALTSQSDGFTNYLIVGVDSRDGVDPGLDTAAQIGLGIAGARSDTMVVLRIGNDANTMVSLPRDLWVNVDGARPAKLNAATVFGGPPALLRTVQAELRIPIHRYLEVDLAGFLNVIDAVGSISIDFASPACDPKSGLDVRSTGAVDLGPEQALAYVRSRTYTEFDSAQAAGLDCAQIRSAGLGTTVGIADFGRTQRQRAFLVALFDQVTATRNPITATKVLSGLTDGLRVDDEMSITDALRLLRDVRGLKAETIELPVSDFAAPDGSSALSLNSASDSVLDLFRGSANRG